MNTIQTKSLSLGYKKYISERVDDLQEILSSEGRIILKAIAGAGKSYASAIIASNYVRGGAGKVIFAVPTTAIAGQQAKEWQRIGAQKGCEYLQNVGLLTGGAGKESDSVNREASIIIAVYDSVWKAASFGDADTLLIVDEYHQLAQDYDYRNKVEFRRLFEAVRMARKCMLVSATPIDFLNCEEFLLSPFAVVDTEQADTGKIELTFVETNSPKDSLFDLRERAQKGAGVLCIKRDNKAHLEHYKNVLGVAKAVQIHSSNSVKKSEEYLQLLESGTLKKGTEALVFTGLIEAGFSLKFAVSAFGIFDSAKSFRRLVQLANRPRYFSMGGQKVNECLRVVVYHAKKKIKESNFDLESSLLRAERAAFRANKEKSESEAKKQNLKATSDDNFVYLCVDSNTYKVDFLGLALKQIQEEENTSSIEDVARNIQEIDSRFSVRFETIQTEKDFALKDFEALTKEKKEELKDQALQVLNSKERDRALYAALRLYKNLEKRSSILEKLALPVLPKEEQEAFIEAHKELFEFGVLTKHLSTLERLLSVGVGAEEAIRVAYEESAKEAAKLADKLVIKKRTKAVVQSPETLRAIQVPLAKADLRDKKALHVLCETHRKSGTLWTIEQLSEKLKVKPRQVKRRAAVLGFGIATVGRKAEGKYKVYRDKE